MDRCTHLCGVIPPLKRCALVLVLGLVASVAPRTGLSLGAIRLDLPSARMTPSMERLAADAQGRIDQWKCLVPGRLFGSVRDPGAEICLRPGGLTFCLRAKRTGRDVAYALTLSSPHPRRGCED